MRVRLVLLAAAFGVLAVPVAASAHPVEQNALAQTLGNASASLTQQPPNDGGANFTKSPNMRLLGFSERRVAPNDFNRFNTDLAFWGDRAYQGQFNGFRILDIDDSRRPREILNFEQCGDSPGVANGGQGDVVVWGSILVRAWDANAQAGRTCDGQPVPVGFEGMHVFDISDSQNPQLVASINLECGTHTLTAVPDLGNRRILVYGSSSNQPCEWLDVVEVPLSRPEESELVRIERTTHEAPPPGEAHGFHCHDTAVILGRANKVACAGGLGYTVWSIGGADGGSRDNPRLLYNREVPEIRDENPPNADNPTGHSAAFSWDGETIIFGHEPGGGTQARCKAVGEPVTNGANQPPPTVQTADMKSFFFYNTDSGALQGKWALTRNQTQEENCTLHNYNIVPTSRDDILVHGSYQSGIGVLDFSNRANAREIAFADPAPLPPTATGGTQDGGDWSSYFYNGIIYETDMTRGLFTWDLDDRDVDRAERVRHLNPQTQEFTIGAKKDNDRWNDGDRWHDDEDDDDDRD